MTLLERAAAELGLEGPVRPIRLALNHVGRAGDGPVVRVGPASQATLSAVSAEVAMIGAAARAGVAVAPVVAGPVAVGAGHVAVAFAHIGHDGGLPLDWGRLGELVARLHAVAAAEWMPTRPACEAIGRYRRRVRLLRSAGRIGAAEAVHLEGRCDELAERLAALEPAPSCLIHGDLHTGNVLNALGGRLVLIDWEEAGASSPLTDLATPLARREHYGLPQSEFARFCAGYGASPADEPYCWAVIDLRAIAGVTYLLLSEGAPQQAEGRRRLAGLIAGRRRHRWRDV